MILCVDAHLTERVVVVVVRLASSGKSLPLHGSLPAGKLGPIVFLQRDTRRVVCARGMARILR